MSIKLLTEHHLEFLGSKGGWTGSAESTHVKMPQCWKPHVATHLMFCFLIKLVKFIYLTTFLIQIKITCKHNIKNIDKWCCISTINLHLLQIHTKRLKSSDFRSRLFVCEKRRWDLRILYCAIVNLLCSLSFNKGYPNNHKANEHDQQIPQNTLQTNPPWGESQKTNIHKTPWRQLKQSNQLASSPGWLQNKRGHKEMNNKTKTNTEPQQTIWGT